MLLFTRSSNSKRALCGLTLGLALLLVAVSAQNQRDQFIIRVAEQPNDLENQANDPAVNAGVAAATDSGGAAIGATQTELQAPDVVVEGLNLLQRNNWVAAAGNAQAHAPQQRKRLYWNSGLRRR